MKFEQGDFKAVNVPTKKLFHIFTIQAKKLL